MWEALPLAPLAGLVTVVVQLAARRVCQLLAGALRMPISRLVVVAFLLATGLWTIALAPGVPLWVPLTCAGTFLAGPLVLDRAGRRELELRIRRREIGETGLVPVVLTDATACRLQRVVVPADRSSITVEYLDLDHGGTLSLRVSHPTRRASLLDRHAPGLTQLTVTYPDGREVCCLGQDRGPFVPISDPERAPQILPRMRRIPAGELASLEIVARGDRTISRLGSGANGYRPR